MYTHVLKCLRWNLFHMNDILVDGCKVNFSSHIFWMDSFPDIQA